MNLPSSGCLCLYYSAALPVAWQVFNASRTGLFLRRNCAPVVTELHYMSPFFLIIQSISEILFNNFFQNLSMTYGIYGLLDN